MNDFIVYGFGKIGQVLVKQLIDAGINLILIIDKTHSGESYHEIRIESPDSVDYQKYQNCNFLIALQSHEANSEVEKLLFEKSVFNVFPYYMDEKAVNKICTSEFPLSTECVMCAYVESCKLFIKKNISKIGPSKIIEQVNFLLTSRCSLNCKYCAAFVPECKEKKIFLNMTYLDLRTYVKRFIEKGYYIHQVMLSGGEPTLNDELVEMLEYLENNSNIGFVKVLSNGTVKLDDNLIFFLKKAKKVVLWIDDYGNKLNCNQRKMIDKNIALLEENACRYVWSDNSKGMWFDFGDFSFRGEKRGEYNNRNCYARQCMIVLPNGWFTVCSRNGMAMFLNNIEKFQNEYADLNDNNSEIQAILGLDYIHACEYCNGSDCNNYVPSGEQVVSETKKIEKMVTMNGCTEH